jgi:hypothetical protein
MDASLVFVKSAGVVIGENQGRFIKKGEGI